MEENKIPEIGDITATNDSSSSINNCLTTWPSPNINVRRCENGFIINRAGKEYLALTPKDVADAMKNLLKGDKK